MKMEIMLTLSKINFRVLFSFLLISSLLVNLSSPILSPNYSQNSQSSDPNNAYQSQPNQQLTLRYSQYKPQNKDNPQITTYRSNIFQLNKKLINQHNERHGKVYRMGLNSFTSISKDQFKEMNGYGRFLQIQQIITVEKLLVSDPVTENTQKQDYVYLKILNASEASAFTMNWTCYANKKIAQRGSCSCSYIITALETTRILLAATKFQYVNLSVQEIISCLPSPTTNSKGCLGGHTFEVFDYIQKYGVGIQQLYPQSPQSFQKGQTPACNTTLITTPAYLKNKIFIKQHKNIQKGNCIQLLQKLQKSPISVVISGKQFQFYSSGTYVLFSQPALSAYWGMTLVGFDGNKGYYVRGSFGDSWGIGGYAYVDSSSGICNWGSYPVVDGGEVKGDVVSC